MQLQRRLQIAGWLDEGTTPMLASSIFQATGAMLGSGMAIFSTPFGGEVQLFGSVAVSASRLAAAVLLLEPA
jgi:hypothetical protein